MKQLNLPHTGPDTAGLARKLADEPLKPAKPQAPCDHGLFSDDVDQADLVDRGRIIGIRRKTEPEWWGADGRDPDPNYDTTHERDMDRNTED